jgi:UDP-N-acetylmuramate: L-alanyl-gamma-D-glutamyl-meso-diaminopimelate ligase
VDLEQTIAELSVSLKAGDHVVIMSNGGFGGVHQRLIKALRKRWEASQ